jgi:3-deoxy-D-manno-octulosonic-acid transferase
MFIFFDIFYLILALVYFPYTLVKRKWHSGMSNRLGKIPSQLSQLDRARPVIWIHAVSVGEVMTIIDLVKRMRAAFADHRIVCSTVTLTGYRLASERLGDDAVVIFAPLDFSWVVNRYVEVINPKIYIATETEIWPNLFSALNTRRVPIIVINGRISDRSFSGYKNAAFLLKSSFQKVAFFAMQSEQDAQRIKWLGASDDKIQVVGNIKFDQIPNESGSVSTKFQISKDWDVFIAGSTHSGEEEIVLTAYQKLRQQFPKLRLIIAPRHIERVPEVAALVQFKQLAPVCFSASRGSVLSDPNEVMVVDEIGRLRGLYSLAKVVFIGKTFSVGGGQNMIEPASAGKVVILGPQTYNFKDVVETFLRNEAMVQIHDPAQLADQVAHLLNNPLAVLKISQRALEVVGMNRGASVKTLSIIERLLPRG